MAEPKGTQTWTVDASAMGGKGMFWRTHCGNDKMLTRPSDAKPGFVANGERFRGVEEYRGWVVNVATQLWLPIRDAPAAGATPIDDEAHRRGFAPVGRGKFARDGNMQAIPYLHAEGCGCGGKYCPKPAEAAPAEAAVRRRKPIEYVRPPPPPPVVPRPPKPESRWWLYALALLALLLYVIYFQPCWVERLPLPEALIAFLIEERSSWPLPGHGWSTAHAPPLHRALSRWFP